MKLWYYLQFTTTTINNTTINKQCTSFYSILENELRGKETNTWVLIL